MKFKGIVKKHLGRGRKMGFPTANIEAPKEIDDGLYLSWVRTATSLSPKGDISPKGEKHAALTFIGAPETFQETDRRAESYILDFLEDIYGQEIEIEIIKKLRDNRKFESEEALIEQMKEDEIEAREFFKFQIVSPPSGEMSSTDLNN